MLQRHHIDLRLMLKTNKNYIHSTRAKCTDQSIYLCNENKCRQISLTTDQKQLNRILKTEHTEKLHVFYLTCGTI